MLLKRLFFSLLGLLFAAILCICFLPWFASTSTGKELLVSIINKKAPGAVKIESLSLKWSGPQVIEGLEFENSNHKLKFSSEKITCSSSLLNLLLPSQEVTIEIPVNAHLPLFKIPSVGHVDILNGKISILSAGVPIVFDLAECHLTADKALSETSIHMKGQTLQNNIQGAIFVDAKASSSSLDSKVLLKNFPVDGVDQILSLTAPKYRGLLVEAVGPSLDLDGSFVISKTSSTASLEVASKMIKASIQTQLKENALTLISPAFLKMDVSPALQKRFFISNENLSFVIGLKSLTIPQGSEGLLVKQASFQGTVATLPCRVGDITISSSGDFSSSDLSSDGVASLSIQMQSGNAVATSKAQMSCKNLFTSKDLSASFDFGKTPTSFLDAFFMDSSISKLVGSSLEGKVSLGGQADSLRLTADITSPLLQMEKGSFLWQNKTLSVVEPFKVRYVLTPAAFDVFVKDKSVTLQKELDVSVLLSQFALRDFSSLSDLKIDALVTSSALFFPKLYNIENLSLRLKADSLSSVSLDLKSDKFSAQYTGKVDSTKNIISWDKPVFINYLLSNQELDSFYKGNEHPALVEKTLIKLEIDPSSLPLKPFALDQVKLTCHLRAKQILLKSPRLIEQIALQNVEATLQFLGAKDSLDFSISLASLGGTLACQGTLQEIINSSDLTLKANLDLQKFPVALIDTFASSALTPLIGETLDLKLAIDKKNDTQTLQIDGKSPQLKVSGGVTLDAKGLFLSNDSSPVNLEFLLTQTAYEKLSKGGAFALSKNALFKASILKLHIPFLENTKALDFSNLFLNLQAENDLITFMYMGSKKPLGFSNTKLSIQKKDGASPLFLSLDTSADADQKGSLHLDAQCKKLLNERGLFELSHVESDLIVSFQKFPSAIFEILLPSKNKSFSSLLGPSFDMTLKSSLQNASGPLAVNLRSQNIKLSMEGALNSGVLTLRENLAVELALTPDTSRVFLKEVNPLSISSITSAYPLSIEIVAKGFSLPLSPFALNQIEAPRARINLGKVFCQNEGNINLMLGLLKSKQAGQNSQLELWFAPIDLSITQGVLNIERTEILVASSYDIALWGRIDLPSNRVNMVLGLTAPCLNAAFNIRDLPSDYVLHIPLTGTLDHVDLNKTVATSKLVALTLWQSKSVAGPAAGAGGALVGGLLNKVLAPPGNEGSTPKAKRPYPWEK